MIFQHTLAQVLSGKKTQTSRIWQDYYRIGNKNGPLSEFCQKHGNGKFHRLWSVKAGKPRTVNYTGQKLAVQPGRGQRGVATIRVLKLWKQDVRTYTAEDAHREGFNGLYNFLDTWVMMHDKPAWAILDNQTVGDWYDYMQERPAERYTALRIEFELVELLKHKVE